VIRVRSVTPRATFLVGYFSSPESLNYHGRPIDPADLIVSQDQRGYAY
jgi:hypothetical protein